ncbi:hypothetical protein AB0B57_22255 [Micromonospora sp. NPDC049101]|uniref:hypothetical protein n=1 Tax=Micromonospora sp. NPDC049101 TaxID=3155032 RepID=UPI0033EF6090
MQNNTFATATTTDPISVLRPFQAHRLYPAAVEAVHRAKVVEGAIAAKVLAEKIAIEFEEVYLRDAATRIQQIMTAAPDAPNYGEPNCE